MHDKPALPSQLDLGNHGEASCGEGSTLHDGSHGQISHESEARYIRDVAPTLTSNASVTCEWFFDEVISTTHVLGARCERDAIFEFSLVLCAEGCGHKSIVARYSFSCLFHLLMIGFSLCNRGLKLRTSSLHDSGQSAGSSAHTGIFKSRAPSNFGFKFVLSFHAFSRRRFFLVIPGLTKFSDLASGRSSPSLARPASPKLLLDSVRSPRSRPKSSR